MQKIMPRDSLHGSFASARSANGGVATRGGCSDTGRKGKAAKGIGPSHHISGPLLRF